ncbi:MAG: hypothetical protein ABW056_03125 [Thermoanaerobaculia bacterium]
MTRRSVARSRSTRAAWLVPVTVLLAVFVLRGTACKKKPGSTQPVVTPASKNGWITPLLTAPPPQLTPTLWRTDITRIPTLPE